jgi:hypothetical protein
MVEYIVYYFLEDIETHEEKIIAMDSLPWDITDHIYFCGRNYIVKDYAEEFKGE